MDNRKRIIELEHKLFGSNGKILYVTSPVYVAYGSHIRVGENFYVNKDCIFMDINVIEFEKMLLLVLDAVLLFRSSLRF